MSRLLDVGTACTLPGHHGDRPDPGAPPEGAVLVVRAWLDEDVRRALLADAVATAAGMGVPVGPTGHDDADLRVVENTEAVHNVVVSALGSCYPARLLGPPPALYRSVAQRARLARDPHGVLAEFGLRLPCSRAVVVWESTSHLRYMVLPRRPVGTAGMAEEHLRGLIHREALLGLAEATAPTAELLDRATRRGKV